MSSSPRSRKILIFRLSSLGDVVLASRALDLLPQGTKVDWVVGRPSEFLLKGDPRIERLWTFPPSASKERGSVAWKLLLQEISKQDYDLVLDLHSVWRTWYARFYFALHAKKKPEWHTLKKERFKRLFYLIFKRFTPKRFRPTLHRDRVERFIYKNLSGARLPLLGKREKRIQSRIGIAPGSAWPGKQWPLSRWKELLLKTSAWSRGKPLLLIGRSNEAILVELMKWAQSQSLPLEALVDCNDREVLAREIRDCEYLICNDSFIAHFSEKSGTPVVMLFGPTRKDFGFGPHLEDSQSVEADVACSPCGKDGSNCYFTGEKRFFCQREITADQVIDTIRARKPQLGLVK